MKKIVNAMSVDVEDYFQVSAFERVVSRADWHGFESRVVRNTHQLLTLFHQHGVRSTFFVLGWVAERFPALVREIAGLGHEVASHGFHHQLIASLAPEQFREDVRRAKAVVEDAAGHGVIGYRAPSFSIVKASLWALDILIEEGYEYDASIFPIHHDRYGIPDAPRHIHRIEREAGVIVEVPGSTVRWGTANLPIAGGGYFRLLPYAWTRWGINRVNAVDQEPVVFYLHPWEIDPDQPRLPVGRTTRLRHYGGLDTTLDRMTRLVTDFRFDSIQSMLTSESVVARYPWNRRPTGVPSGEWVHAAK
jgi:polysaccharide deacetylase family protein (PEP-CTERM system associated)